MRLTWLTGFAVLPGLLAAELAALIVAAEALLGIGAGAGDQGDEHGALRLGVPWQGGGGKNNPPPRSPFAR